METFSGVLVCCTNFLKDLVSAVLRRFAFKVVFQPLSEGGCIALFKRYFPEAALSVEAVEHLARLDGLTPGDFKAVISRTRVNPGTSAEALVFELETECAYKQINLVIGFHT